MIDESASLGAARRHPTKQTLLALILCTLAAVGAPAHAADAPSPTAAVDATVAAEVRQIWKMLDYLAVDYTGAVKDGAVVSAAEYAEMKEFGNTALARLKELPARATQPELMDEATRLQAAIASMTAPSEVARVAHDLADSLLAAYPVPTAPTAIPNLTRGAEIYANTCTGCHGDLGRGDGPTGEHLDPPPIAFTDHTRARERSLFSLYEVVSQGLADTAMAGFDPELSADQRWDAAFFVANFSSTPEVVNAGEALWSGDATLRARVPNIETLVRLVESGLAAEIGDEKARPLMAYLRAHPEVVGQTNGADGLALARSQLAASLKAYQAGDVKAAGTLALSSYLDGFEPIEAMLRGRDADLLARVEGAMIDYRSRINAQAPAAEVAAQAAVLNGLFGETDSVLSAEQDATATFLGAFTILLREGLEALLVVVAMITFLAKVERRDMLPYVHVGWIGALAAGGATWYAAATMVTISGANRELTEGVASLFAAAVLIGVGIWMHQKSLAGRWQVYLKERLSAALTKKSAFFLFFLAFVAVYREVFETILFYIALAVRGDKGSILAGLAAGVAALIAITVILLRTSRRLPISTFFGWSSLLIAALAVILAGKGFAALQEAGLVPAISVSGAPRIEALGVFPSMLPLLAQATVLVIALAGYFWNTRSTKPSTAA